MSLERSFVPDQKELATQAVAAGEQGETQRPFTFDTEAETVRDQLLNAMVKYGNTTAEVTEAGWYTRQENDRGKYRLVTQIPPGSLVGIQNRASRLALLATADGSCVQITELLKLNEDGTPGEVVQGAGKVAKEFNLAKNEVRTVIVEDADANKPLIAIPMPPSQE